MNATYMTSVGEQRPIPLADVSSMDLNVESNVRVHYTRKTAMSGYWAVKCDSTSSATCTGYLRLMTERAVLDPQSTQFNIYHRATRTTISVIAGEVSVRLPKGMGTSADRIGKRTLPRLAGQVASSS